jgi:hypothetical protein
VDVLSLLQRRDEEAMAGAAPPGTHARAKWLHVIQELCLTQQQRQQLLLQRTAHLALMRRIYQQRQQLNMQAVALLLLGARGSSAAAVAAGRAPGTECAAGTCVGPKAAQQLEAVLRLIKENLRREQRAAMEINSCTLCRLLAPVQAALYVCEAFPFHCDALAMW